MKNNKLNTKPFKALNEYNYSDCDRMIYLRDIKGRTYKNYKYLISPLDIIKKYILHNICNNKAISQTDVKNHLRNWGYYITESNINLILQKEGDKLIKDINTYISKISVCLVVKFLVNENTYFIFTPIYNPVIKNDIPCSFKTFIVTCDASNNSYTSNNSYITVPVYIKESRYKVRNRARWIYIQQNKLENIFYKNTNAYLAF